ncbi:MAG: nitroreductase family protein [Methanofollis sp.]|uniref:nitroreductase family protein n=1 Tax=Methanofollis sp. TaxID=2052835 RepID=UPI0026307B5B|nr:nitroreductase family protein [Methanofollis sp.]MDD4254879.1 nitroreductase family protein [Methanofollis sp.]
MEAPITFDEDTCTRCGTCAEICPLGTIIQERPKALPLLVRGREATCIRCGHCVAVCPTGAVSAGYPAEGPQYLTEGSAAIAPADLAAYLRNRRSIRRYEDRTVDRETIEALLDVVRFAPSAANRQPVRWLVVHDPAEVRRLAGLTVEWMREMAESGAEHPLAPIFPALVRAWDAGEDPIFRGAPHLVVAHAEAWNPSAFTDSIIALTWLEVAAPSFGLGTCWAGFFQTAFMSSPALAAALNLPDGHLPQSAMVLGYPKHRYARLPGREKARVTWR